MTRLVLETDTVDSDFSGCGEAEVEKVERRLGVEFPASLRVLFRIMGKSAGPLFSDCTYRLSELERSRAVANETLANNNGPSLPFQILVISERYGEQFLFLRELADVDSRVWRYYEGDAAFTNIGVSLVTLVEQETQVYLDAFRKRGSIRRYLNRYNG